MISALIQRAKSAARRTAFGAAGVACLVVGVGFLSAALWLAIALTFGGVVASLVLGLLYAGFGLVLLALASRKPVAHTPAVKAAQPAPGQSDLIAAFLGGVDAGKRIGHRPAR